MEFAIMDTLTGFSIDMLKVVLILLVGFITGNVLKKILMKFFDITGILNLTKNNAIGRGLADIGYKGGLLELIVDILKWTIYLIGLIVSAEIIKLTGISVILKNMLIFIPKLLTGVIIILFGILIADFIGKIIKESTENKNKPHLNEINSIASEFIQFLLYFITAIMALQIVGLNMTIIMVVLTIVLATIGLFIIVALQDFAPNYSASIYLQSINLKKGDHITSEKFSGVIEDIGHINTTIETNDGIMRIPNRELILKGFEKIKSMNNDNNKTEEDTAKEDNDNNKKDNGKDEHNNK